MKKISFLLLLIVFSFGLFASPVSLESAKSVAVKFYLNYTPKSNVTVSDVITYQKDGITTFYVFVFEGTGFVIISADDAVIPILGYSTDATFDKNNIPIAEKNWLQSYSEQIKKIIAHDLSNVETKKKWDKIKNNEFEKSIQAVNPLCSTLWDQSSPYYNSCPIVSSYHCVTGCIATAMAQIMKYWNYPSTGVGSHTYTPATNGSVIGPLTVDFSATTYDWVNMVNTGGSTSVQEAAVATLMYHCGVSVNMDYDPNGSGAYAWDVSPALINYFNYSPTAELKIMDNFTAANWQNLLEGELDAGRPVLYTGSGNVGGHAFVCDGYDSSNKFHINWGWSGASNGYFAIGSLNPMGETFNSNNMAVVRITPPSSAPIADFVADNTTPAVDSTVNFTNNSTNNPTTYSWVFDGGTPSTSTSQTPPAITYNTAGVYQVSLTVSNSNGSDTKVRSSYIDVGGTPSAWIKQNTGFTTASRGIDHIAIVNPYIVWASAYDGTGGNATIQEFTRTVNGGITWTPGTIVFANSTNYGITNLFPFNDTVCFAAMYPATAANGGVIVKTTDGGTTWSILPNSPDYSTSWLDFVYFFNENDGVCMGDPNTSGEYIIYTTSDGGNSWTQTPVTNIPNCTSGETGIVDLCDAIGDNLWFGTTKGRIYKTTDKGLTWTVTTTGLGTSAEIEPVFKDAMTGIVVGINYTTGAFLGLKKTTDGGATWSTINPTGFYVKMPHLCSVPGTSSIWVDVTPGPGLGSSYSNDNCTSFLDIDTGSVQYTTVKFYDSNTGWAGGFNTSSSDGGIYKWNSTLVTSAPEPVKQISEISIYPNPTNNFVTIKFPSVLISSISVDIYNLLGEKVLSKEIQSGTNIAKFDISKYNDGVYLLIINDGNKITTKRISKMN